MGWNYRKSFETKKSKLYCDYGIGAAKMGNKSRTVYYADSYSQIWKYVPIITAKLYQQQDSVDGEHETWTKRCGNAAD